MTNSESGLRRSARPPSDTGGATPLRYGDDPYVWASWLYYQEGMTQNDIAQTMGISRATVITYLNEARERGIVNIAIEPARLASLTIAQSLKSHFSLRDCLVVPNGADDQALGDRLGAAGAMAVRKFLKSGDTLAVAGGRTVMAVGDNLRSHRLAGCDRRSGDRRRHSQKPRLSLAVRLDDRFGREVRHASIYLRRLSPRASRLVRS